GYPVRAPHEFRPSAHGVEDDVRVRGPQVGEHRLELRVVSDVAVTEKAKETHPVRPGPGPRHDRTPSRPATTASTEMEGWGGSTGTGSPARTPRPRIRPVTGASRPAPHCARMP